MIYTCNDINIDRTQHDTTMLLTILMVFFRTLARWCDLLSNKPDTRVILIFSDREAEYMHHGGDSMILFDELGLICFHVFHSIRAGQISTT